MRLNNLLRFFILFCISIAGCTNTNNTPPVISFPTQTSIPITEMPIPPTQTITPTFAPTVTPTPLETLQPVQITETLRPLIKDPMNCAVPCFWGIIPGETSLDEARVFFSKLGFTPFEGIDQNSPSSGMYFYTISYGSGSGDRSSVTLYAFENLVENVIVDPDIPKPKAGNQREWIAYSPETLIKRYGNPSSVRFWVSSYGVAGLPPNTGIDMIMYFDTSDLIVDYSGYGMTPESFCPLSAPFDFVRLWMGHNPPNPPLFGTVSLEKATSLTTDQFTQLMLGDPKKACFSLNRNAFQ